MDSYDHNLEEKKILDFWKREKIYAFNKKAKGKIYSIDTPPPTVSGDMHAGHAFSYSQQDFIARFHRMKNSGNGLFYPFGTDDNGLPTERLVERINNVKSKEMSRADFIELCLKTLGEITPSFVKDWKNLGISADFSLSYSTIDNNSRKISQKSFLGLYKKRQIYEKEFPTIWCPECQTSIAQAELEDREQETFFVTIKFQANGKNLEIATTRPELLGACVAVFINPEDKRYKNLKGKTAKVPLFGFSVPIIFDKSASMEKGTGAMMICSYGDKYDVDAISKHKLKPWVIFNKEGKIKTGEYAGLKIREARKKILEALEKAGLVSDKRRITNTVNVHDKCGTEIEFIPTEQWFIKILDKKGKLISQGKKINWHPKHMLKRYENWVRGLNWDWTISRNRHFGVPIPVWHCRKCKEIILPQEKELPLDPTAVEKKCPKCKNAATPETKVLDTWATSSLSPQIASSLVGNKIKIPFSLRPQGHDIIRTWAFYTIVKSYLHENKIPWKDIMISGFVTLGGEKLSKSKGITINPREIMHKYGADSLRYLSSSSGLGQDLEYQEKELVAGQKLIKKLLNASNFVFMNLKDYKPKKPKKLLETDKAFLELLKMNTFYITSAFENYNYSNSKLSNEMLFWHNFCDNYLEIVKRRVYNGSKQEKESAFYSLYSALLIILKMFAPIIPFITEHIYQTHFRKTEKEKSIHISAWPEKIDIKKINTKLIKEYVKLELIISMIRQEKSKANKSMNSEIILTLPNEKLKDIKLFLEDLKHTVNAKEIKTGDFKVEFL